MTPSLRAVAACPLLILACFALLVTCDEETEESKRKADDRRQLQAQLEAECTQRQQAERAVLAAEQASNNKIIAIVAGSCVAVLVVGLTGIAIGSRALKRARKEQGDG